MRRFFTDQIQSIVSIRQLADTHKDMEYGATKIRTDLEKEMIEDYEDESIIKEGLADERERLSVHLELLEPGEVEEATKI
jgi:hypothetical protein